MVTSNVACSRQPLQLAVQHLQALFRDVVGLNVIDADLQVIEAGAVERPDSVRR